MKPLLFTMAGTDLETPAAKARVQGGRVEHDICMSLKLN